MTMLELDHITIIAPSLADGANHVRAVLGVDPSPGGSHPEMGTHNLVLRLGNRIYLEIIAADPAAPPPARPRWFGLGDAGAVQAAWDEGRRMRGWVAETNDIDSVLAQHGALLGEKARISRGERTWLFSIPKDGALPADGVAPSVVDREGRPGAIGQMPELGARLISFHLEHPDPGWAREFYAALGVSNAPDVIKGSAMRYRAIIETPAGTRELY